MEEPAASGLEDMVERVAMAIYGRGEKAWRGNANTLGAIHARLAASRAIEAMREPTEVMAKSGSRRGYDYGIEEGENCGCTRDIYRAMIDAALQANEVSGS